MAESRTMFVLKDSQLQLVQQEPYAKEQELQSLLSRYPVLLRGDKMGEVALRFLLLQAEALVPDSENGPGRWQVDHVFIDQEATPTFVEVKRSSDVRIRREVVGQILEYAANAVRHWTKGALEALASERATSGGLSVSELLERELGIAPGDTA